MIGANTDNAAQNALQMIYGLDDFLERHVGDVKQPGDLFVINNERIVCNNLHYEVALSGYMPNGTAVTEAQALIVLGYIYAYRATGDKEFLKKARVYMDAYIKVYYQGQPIPYSPQLWRCHWAVNGKEPFVAAGPTNYAKASAAGALKVPVNFVNGVGWVPGGQPYGNKVQRVYQVYSGQNTWTNVFADVKWPGRRYDMAYFVDYRGFKMRANGSYVDDVSFNIDGTPTADSLKYVDLASARKIVLQGADANFTGTLNINFACRSGPTIGRNKPFEGWPMWSHVSKEEYGNAVDAEEWFAEAAYLLFEDTKDEKYLRAYNSCYYTLQQIADLGGEEFYFIRTTTAKTPHTEGISYDWATTTNADYYVGREDRTGYIIIEKEEELFAEDISTIALEQIAVINRASLATYFTADYSNTAYSDTQFKFSFKNALDAPDESARIYRFATTGNGSTQPQQYVIPFTNLVAVTDAAGNEYAKFGLSSMVEYNGASYASEMVWGLLGDSRRNDSIINCYMPTSSSGVVAGFWSFAPNTRGLQSITYRSLNGEVAIKVRDARGYRYQYVLPTVANWTTLGLDWSWFSPMDGATGPAVPHNGLTQIELVPSDAMGYGALQVYCFGEVPPLFQGEYGYVTKLGIEIRDHNGFVARLGDVRINGQPPLNLKYTPGAFTFTTNYSREKNKKEYWRGVLNIGYQYGVVWALGGFEKGWLNIIDAMYDSQEHFSAHYASLGRTIMGPFAPIYLWPRYDNIGYGPPDSWTFYEWGDREDSVWGGYNSRAYYAAARLYHALWERGYPIPPKLDTILRRYTAYLVEFMDTHDDYTPTMFPNPDVASAEDKAKGWDMPYNDGWDADPDKSRPDHTGHMTASWMAGAILLSFAGSTIPGLDRVIQGLYREFARSYEVIEAGDSAHHMSGSFSAWAGGNYFYGFWAGEIFRALALYIQYTERQRLLGEDESVIDPDDILLEDGEALLTEAADVFAYDAAISFNHGVQIGLQDESGVVITEDAADNLAYEV